ncbi:MAG: ribonuclease HII [Clostridia bacterium]|nr:ribonuclease HII [Clostridia bacterium]
MTKQREEERLTELSKPDRAFWTQDGIVLAGMDEVGRGPLAGPVVVGCVVMPPEPLLRYVNDSKKVTEKRREALYEQIMQVAIEAHTAWVDPAVIDEINILEATKRAFCEAFAKMQTPITDVLIDALTGLQIPARQHSLIHGDALSYSIAAASIVAKVERDRYMVEQDKLYPGYGFARNKGYGTKEHMDAIRTLGMTPIHRRSFLKKLYENG